MHQPRVGHCAANHLSRGRPSTGRVTFRPLASERAVLQPVQPSEGTTSVKLTQFGGTLLRQLPLDRQHLVALPQSSVETGHVDDEEHSPSRVVQSRPVGQCSTSPRLCTCRMPSPRGTHRSTAPRVGGGAIRPPCGDSEHSRGTGNNIAPGRRGHQPWCNPAMCSERARPTGAACAPCVVWRRCVRIKPWLPQDNWAGLLDGSSTPTHTCDGLGGRCT